MPKLYFFAVCIFISVMLPIKLLFSGENKENLHSYQQLDNQQAADLLGWMTDTQADNLCQGCYQEPSVIQQPLPAEGATRISADEASLLSAGKSQLRGDVIVDRPDQQLRSNIAYIYRDNQGEVTAIDLQGDVEIHQPGQLLLGQSAHYNLEDDTGYVDDVLYRVALDEQSRSEGDTRYLCGLSAWGTAENVVQLEQGQYQLRDITFTSCPPDQEAWQVKASTLKIDQEKNEGEAFNAWFSVKGLPFFYMPYYNFPLDDSRKSGFLMPVIGVSDRSGFELALPYYWNMAPNYDLIITPSLYTKRGLMWGGDFRYLTNTGQGDLGGTFIPKDRAFADFIRDNPQLGNLNDSRGSFYWDHRTRFNSNWSAGVDYSSVTDDFYFQDYSKRLEATTQNQLRQRVDMRYVDEHWRIVGQLQRYQTLQPFNEARTSEVYSTLPELTFYANYPYVYSDVNFRLNGSYTNFVWPGEQPRPEGHRFHISPVISTPYYGAASYITPSIELHQTSYQLKNQPDDFANTINRTLPIVSVDSGLFFERQTQWLGSGYTQTLEPRLFYLYVPFTDQSQIPDFDSGYNIFTYNQLFRTNRFSGTDRVGDANQVTLALTSRYLDNNSGAEKFRVSVGQIYYFEDRRVTISDNLEREQRFIGFTPLTDNSSPIASEMMYRFDPQWYAIGDVVWDPNVKKMNNSRFNLYYNPQGNHIINLGYTFLAEGERGNVANIPGQSNNDLHQTNISFSWPINERWNSLGTWSYNISKRYSMEYYVGLEYESCCWALRTVVGQTFNRLDQNFNPLFNRGIYLQVLLKGIGTVGLNNPSQIITNSIPGYHDRFR